MSTMEAGIDAAEIIARTGASYKRLRAEVGKVIVGQDEVVEMMILALLCRGHCLVVGVPGLAKTLLVQTLGQALDLEFNRVQFTPDLMPTDILGTEVMHEDKETGDRAFHFVQGPVFTNIMLADEINRAPPKTQSALLEAMQERQVTCAGKTYRLDEPFLTFATQNPIEHEGTYPLPEAQLDRFLFNLLIDYPEPEHELEIIERYSRQTSIAVEPVFKRQEIIDLQRLILEIPAPKHVLQYAYALVAHTRPKAEGASEYIQKYVEWGAGPRAGIALVMAAKALAILHGHPSASCDEIRKVYSAVMRHRVIPSYHAIGESIDVEMILAQILESVKEPQYNDGR